MVFALTSIEEATSIITMFIKKGCFPMCGRFTLTVEEQVIEKLYKITNSISGEYHQRYNIAPSQTILTIMNDGTNNRAGYLKWGLIPFWAKDPKIGYKMINARAETLQEKASFKYAYKKRRCLILADGFYEWKRDGSEKKPMRITLKENNVFAMAGLWEKWTSPAEETIHSCTIVTTKPNELMQNIHDRMPVILTKESEKLWLDRSMVDPYILQEALQPYDAKEMIAYEVSSLVNSPRNEGEELIMPV